MCDAFETIAQAVCEVVCRIDPPFVARPMMRLLLACTCHLSLRGTLSMILQWVDHGGDRRIYHVCSWGLFLLSGPSALRPCNGIRMLRPGLSTFLQAHITG